MNQPKTIPVPQRPNKCAYIFLVLITFIRNLWSSVSHHKVGKFAATGNTSLYQGQACKLAIVIKSFKFSAIHSFHVSWVASENTALSRVSKDMNHRRRVGLVFFFFFANYWIKKSKNQDFKNEAHLIIFKYHFVRKG